MPFISHNILTYLYIKNESLPESKNITSFKGLPVDLYKDGSVRYSMNLLRGKFPETLKEDIEKVSISLLSEPISSRKSGKYLHLTAEGFVENTINPHARMINIFVIGPNFEDAKDLFLKILGGKIAPFDDWEGEQI